MYVVCVVIILHGIIIKYIHVCTNYWLATEGPCDTGLLVLRSALSLIAFVIKSQIRFKVFAHLTLTRSIHDL